MAAQPGLIYSVGRMLTNSKKLKGLTVQAIDGELGVVADLYFDDQTWGIRYFTVETGGWLGGRTVLISPISVTETDWEAKRLHVTLTKLQVENSPSIDTHKPVSRQHEAEYLGYYGYPYYWDGPGMWGAGFYPAGLPIAAEPGTAVTAPADSHLRSMQEVSGYEIEALGGDLGHVDGFLVEDSTWAIRYIEVATRNWWPGKKVLVSPGWIERVSWAGSKVSVGLTRELISDSPEYLESIPVTREMEDRLYAHYGRAPYWLP